MGLLLRFKPTRFALVRLADHNVLRARVEEALRTEIVHLRAASGGRHSGGETVS